MVLLLTGFPPVCTRLAHTGFLLVSVDQMDKVRNVSSLYRGPLSGHGGLCVLQGVAFTFMEHPLYDQLCAFSHHYGY